MNLATIISTVNGLGTKAPFVLQFIVGVVGLFQTLAGQLGITLPTAAARAFTPNEQAFITTHKLGDGTLLTGLENLLNSPLGAALESLLLKLLASAGSAPTA